MKRIWVAAALVLLALGLGYALGYRHGTRNEKAAWEATEASGIQGIDGWQMTWSKSSGPLTTNVGDLRHKRLQVYYSNPHIKTGYIFAHYGPTPVNVPDPRDTLVK